MAPTDRKPRPSRKSPDGRPRSRPARRATPRIGPNAKRTEFPLTVTEAAERLNLTPATVRRWVRGRQPADNSSIDQARGRFLTERDLDELARYDLFQSLGGVFHELNRLSANERDELASAIPRSL